MEERNIMGELNMYRQLGLKPNFSEIGRRYGLDRHTVARYWNEGGDVDDGRCNRPSGFDAHSALIAEKAAMPGATKKAVHEYLLHRCGGRRMPGYNAFTHYCLFFTRAIFRISRVISFGFNDIGKGAVSLPP